MMPLVSILIPAYNAERYLATAVESALAQTHPDVEVIIADDGSSNSTPILLDRLQHRYGETLKVMSQPNRGGCAARNAGAALASGAWLQFLDADDGQTFWFASQVKALVAAGAVDTSPDPAGHAGFFLWGHVPKPFTLYAGIESLPPGSTMTVGSNGRRATRRPFSESHVFERAEQNLVLLATIRR